MNYTELRNIAQKWPIIFSRDLIRRRNDAQIIRNQLERWRRKKLLIKLKKGLFLFNANDRKINPSRAYIANQLYSPSYLSLEYALNYYGLIPERVSDLTSITTRKTFRVTNEIGVFIYQHIKPVAFRGFVEVIDESGLIFFVAEPEKALVDFFYLNLSKFKKQDMLIFKESFRFQNIEKLDMNKIMKFAGLFENNKLMEISSLFCKFLRKEKRT